MAKIDGRTLNHKALEHLRILAVKRVVEDGEKPSLVMDSLGLCRTTIYPWLREFKDKGLQVGALAESRSPPVLSPGSPKPNDSRFGAGLSVKTPGSMASISVCGRARSFKP